MAVGPAGVGGDQESGGLWKAGSSHLLPPAPDGLDGEGCRVGGVADRHPSFVVGEVVDPVGHGPAELFVDEVMGLGPRRLAGRVVLAPAVGELAHQLLLLGVDADHRIAAGQKRRHLVVQVDELGVTVRVGRPLLLLGTGPAASSRGT